MFGVNNLIVYPTEEELEEMYQDYLKYFPEKNEKIQK